MIGHVLLSKPELLVLSYCELGNLRDYLRRCRGTKSTPQTISLDQQLGFGSQIASGMAFLGKHNIIHRDLAA